MNWRYIAVVAFFLIMGVATLIAMSTGKAPAPKEEKESGFRVLKYGERVGEITVTQGDKVNYSFVFRFSNLSSGKIKVVSDLEGGQGLGFELGQETLSLRQGEAEGTFLLAPEIGGPVGSYEVSLIAKTPEGEKVGEGTIHIRVQQIGGC